MQLRLIVCMAVSVSTGLAGSYSYDDDVLARINIRNLLDAYNSDLEYGLSDRAIEIAEKFELEQLFTRSLSVVQKRDDTQERLRQERLRQERLRQERLRQEQLRQEQLRQEQLRQEQLRQEQLRQEQLRQEQLRQERLRRGQPPSSTQDIMLQIARGPGPGGREQTPEQRSPQIRERSRVWDLVGHLARGGGQGGGGQGGGGQGGDGQ